MGGFHELKSRNLKPNLEEKSVFFSVTLFHLPLHYFFSHHYLNNTVTKSGPTFSTNPICSLVTVTTTTTIVNFFFFFISLSTPR
jgi:hypothetical protein